MTFTDTHDPNEQLARLNSRLASIDEHLRLLRLPVPPLLTIPEVAATLQVSARTVYRLLDSGKLVGCKPNFDGGKNSEWRIQASDLQAFIDRSKIGPPCIEPTYAASPRHSPSAARLVIPDDIDV